MLPLQKLFNNPRVRIIPERVLKLAMSSMVCKYEFHPCSHPKLEGYDFCIRHILSDKDSPYKQCSYVYGGNNRRCHKATPKGEKENKRDAGYCAFHARKTQLLRQKSTRRHKPPATVETLLSSLNHYVPAVNKQPTKDVKPDETGVDDISAKDEHVEVTASPDPYVNIDASKVNGSVSRVLDFASESDSDLETAVAENTLRTEDLELSETESVDGPLEDPLKHAGHYTAEEVSLITRDKLIRLQSLYIEQFRRLQHTLKERRRNYLHALKKEKETLSSINSQVKESLKEQKLYKKLKAYNRYHKRSGIEAVLHKKALERRALATDGLNVRPPPLAKCIFTEGGVKCGEKTLPVAKYCMKHILNDTNQVLFRHCGVVCSDVRCREPVLNIFENTYCVYHMNSTYPGHSAFTKVKGCGDTEVALGPRTNSICRAGTSKTRIIVADASKIDAEESHLTEQQTEAKPQDEEDEVEDNEDDEQEEDDEEEVLAEDIPATNEESVEMC